MSTAVIFVDESEFPLAAYDADDGLSKQLALRFTARGGTLCENIEDASYVIINTDKDDWNRALRTYVSGDRIALASGWIDASINAGRALLADDQFGGFRLEQHDAPPVPEQRTPLPTPRTTPTSSAPPNMSTAHQSPQTQPTPGPSASPTGQQNVQAGVFSQAGPSGGYYQGQSPVAASFSQPQGFTGDVNALAALLASQPHVHGLVNQPHQYGNSIGQSMPYPQPQPPPSQQQYQQQPMLGQSQHPYSMSQATLHPQFMPQWTNQLLLQMQIQQQQAAQMQQELQNFDLNNPKLIDTLIAVAQHHNNVAQLQLLQAIQACQPPRVPTTPMLSNPPPPQSQHTAYSPVEDDVFASSTQSTRKRKSEQMDADEDEPPAAPRKTMKKPSIGGSASSAKDKGKQKAARTSGPSSSRKVSPSPDRRDEASGSGEKPAVKHEKSKGSIFTKRNGSPMQVFVVDGMYGSKRQAILNAVKANGGVLKGAGQLEEVDFCIFDRSNSKDYKTLYGRAVNANANMVSGDFVPKCVEAGKLLRYRDFPVPEGAMPGPNRVGRPSNSFFADEKSRKSQNDDFFNDDEDDSDDSSSSDDEPAPRQTRASASEKRSGRPSVVSPRAKGRSSAGGAASSSSAARTTKTSTTVKSAKEQSAVKQPKLIQKPKISVQATSKPALAKSGPKPGPKSASKPAVTTAAERDSPNPPPPEKFDGKRYKFTDEEMEWAWAKIARMAQQDQYLTLARACEGLAKKTPHHSASSWRGKVERDLDKFNEILADANPSMTARPSVSSPSTGMPPKLRVNSFGSLTGPANETSTTAAAASTTQPMQVDEPVQPSQTNAAPASTEEIPPIQSGEEDDLEQAVSFLMNYEPPHQLEDPNDESVWPVLNRTLPPCKSRPSWKEFWEKYENTVLQGVRVRVDAARQQQPETV